MRLKNSKILILITFLMMLANPHFCQDNNLKGTVKVRKRGKAELRINDNRRVFSKYENPLKGVWVLQEYEINDKSISLSKNTHVLEFYDSTYRFRRIYEKPKYKIYEGTFPVGIIRNKINSSKDSVIGFKNLNIMNYHLLFEEDSLVVTNFTEMDFRNFTYSKDTISFEVKEYDEKRTLIRTLYFVYSKTKD